MHKLKSGSGTLPVAHLKKERIVKQSFIMALGWALLFIFPLGVQAQEPDALPSHPELPEPGEGSDKPDSELFAEKASADGVFDFCGQQVDLTSWSRQIKLNNELRHISRYSSTLQERAAYYFPIVEPILEEESIPEDFKYLMVIESAMNPVARSNKGAAGLWQFMPGTADDYGLVVNGRVDERFHIEKATRAACRYLNDAYRKFGDWVAVAQSYNIGQGRINNELSRQQVDDALDLRLVEETNRYIYRIFAAKIIFTHPIDFGLNELPSYYKKIRQPMRYRR